MAECSQLEIERWCQCLILVKQPHGSLHGAEQPEVTGKELSHPFKPSQEKRAVEIGVVRDKLSNSKTAPAPDREAGGLVLLAGTKAFNEIAELR